MSKAQYHKERGSALLRFLDRYIGMVTLFLLRVVRQQKPLPNEVKSIGLIRLAGGGDTLLLNGIIKDLEKRYPQSKKYLFCGNSNYEFALLLEGITVVNLPILHPLQAIRLIRRHSLDLLFDFEHWARISAFFTFFSQAKFRCGYKTKKQHRHALYDAYVETSYEHQCDSFRKLIHSFAPDHSPPDIALEATLNPKLIVLHLFPGGSRYYLKEWPEEYWIELMYYLLKHDYKVALTGVGKEQRERTESLLKKLPPSPLIINLVGMLKLRETAHLLKSAKLVISVDTGIMHLASCLNCPLLALFGPTDPNRWGPLNSQSVSLRLTPFKACIDQGFENRCRIGRCMRAIQPMDVIKVLEDIFLESGVEKKSITSLRRISSQKELPSFCNGHNTL